MYITIGYTCIHTVIHTYACTYSRVLIIMHHYYGHCSWIESLWYQKCWYFFFHVLHILLGQTDMVCFKIFSFINCCCNNIENHIFIYYVCTNIRTCKNMHEICIWKFNVPTCVRTYIIFTLQKYLVNLSTVATCTVKSMWAYFIT